MLFFPVNKSLPPSLFSHKNKFGLLNINRNLDVLFNNQNFIFMEAWSKIKGFENIYSVSNFGRVYSFITDRYLKPSPNFKYLRVKLCKEGYTKDFRVHRLVAKSFLPIIKGKIFINHINGVKADNRAENLEWCTHKENVNHAFKVLKRKGSMQGRTGQNNPRSKSLAMVDVSTGVIIKIFSGLKECERQTGFKNQNISSVCRGIYKKAYGYNWMYI